MLRDQSIARRRDAYQAGRAAERLCVWLLRLKGYRVLARDWRVPVGEIDILARRGSVLAAIEVKRRGDLATAAASVGPQQRRRILRALEAFVARRPALGELTLRFDVMLVTPRAMPRHIVDAWRP
ncbi:MAG TPA: YraN family protein [Candidatus Sulfotelmatobacter sp.]|nr:YraN family protein [Candidatus Sulfotelmatobacter sp.]